MNAEISDSDICKESICGDVMALHNLLEGGMWINDKDDKGYWDELNDIKYGQSYTDYITNKYGNDITDVELNNNPKVKTSTEFTKWGE